MGRKVLMSTYLRQSHVAVKWRVPNEACACTVGHNRPSVVCACVRRSCWRKMEAPCERLRVWCGQLKVFVIGTRVRALGVSGLLRCKNAFGTHSLYPTTYCADATATACPPPHARNLSHTPCVRHLVKAHIAKLLCRCTSSKQRLQLPLDRPQLSKPSPNGPIARFCAQRQLPLRS